MSSIWKTLSAIDCNEHVDKKGQFSYLSWTWAWAIVKENYPEADYHLEDDTIYADGTMEVRVSVSIDTVTFHTMWLPVLNFQNKAIANPDAFAINSARMRCLVKCLAMFGLGHYIYAGESAPQEAEEDISSALAAIENSTTMDELQGHFKSFWRSLPKSRAALTKAKDLKKKELSND